MQKHPTILVTGCAGFIGSNFVKVFKERFPKSVIVGIDDLSTGRKELLDQTIPFHKGSVCDDRFVDGVFKKHRPEYVFHFAARPSVPESVAHPAAATHANVTGTVMLLEKSRDYGVKRFIFSSSSSVYGDAKKLPTKEAENGPDPVSPYAIQKYSDELFCKAASRLYGLDTVCLRYFNVFGPGQYGDSAYANVISAWLTGMYFPKDKELFIEGNGTQSRDFCYVGNVADANIMAMLSKKKCGGECFNIANGKRTTLLEVKDAIEKYSGKKLALKKRPSRAGDVRHTHANIAKATQWLGYVPRTDFVTGLRQTIAWFEARKK